MVRQYIASIALGRVATQALPIPAEGAATLAPGGDHLMLIGLRGPLAAGGTVTFTLVFANGGEVVVPFAVRDARPH